MAVPGLLNRVGMLITTLGTGSVTASIVISNRYNTPAEAGAVNGLPYYWMLEEDNDYEIFEGTWTLSGTTVSRDTVLISKIAGVKGTTKMTLAGSATLRSVTPAEVLVRPCFFAHKNGTDQTGILPDTVTTITYPTEGVDIGGYYNAGTSVWRPPAGQILVGVVGLVEAGVVDQAYNRALILQAGSIAGDQWVVAGAANLLTVAAQKILKVNGSEDISAACYLSGAGNKTISGDVGLSYFYGHWIGP